MLFDPVSSVNVILPEIPLKKLAESLTKCQAWTGRHSAFSLSRQSPVKYL
jgi:hypothetical protein